MTALARGVFFALIVATFAAFFVAQRLKSTPPVIREVSVFPFFSPNGDGRFDRARIGFELKESDRVDLTVVNRDGDEVRELLDNRRVRSGQRVSERWDGRDAEGRPVRDGTYRARLVLRRQGRSVIVPRNIVLDTTPPKPRVLSIGPQRDDRPVPELLPRRDGKPAAIRFYAPGRKPEVEVWRTSPSVRRVIGLDEGPLREGIGIATWAGDRRGRRVAPGSFVVVVRSRDRAGNIGESVATPVKLRPGVEAPGRGGITVRYLAVAPPLLPVGAGREFEVGVDARGQTYNWTLRRVAAPRPVRRSRRATGGPLRRRAPNGESGLFLFEARTNGRATQVPIAVDDRRNNRVLVVLPSTTWQGRNQVDDDGDGLPNTLDLGAPVRLNRVFAFGLPPGLTENEAPLLAQLDRQGLRYDLTTDAGLAVGRGPKIAGHRGILVAGDAVWLTEDVRRQLRTFVAAGGALASLGTGSLRREVRQTPRRLIDPSPAAAEDLFGARLGPVRRQRVALTNLEDDPKIQLFAGEEGLFEDVEAWEPTIDVGDEARRLSVAVTDADDAQEVIVAARFGKGLVIRTGIPGFATRLSGDTASAELLGRIWTLLRTG